MPPSPATSKLLVPLRPGSMLGVLGGGQLGRMWVHAAQAQGYRVTVLEPDAASPAGASADRHVVAAYADAAALDDLARSCAAVTTEFENVPAQALQRLQSVVPVSPPPAAVLVCQHRAREKALFEQAGVPCAPHALLQQAADLHDSARLPLQALLPGLLKTAQLGYDGKGQRSVATWGELVAAWHALGSVPCVLEKRLPLQTEISVIVARGADGQTVHLPVQQNLHRDGILAVTQVPVLDVPAQLCEQAVRMALQLAQTLHYVGVLCVEFFVVRDDTLPLACRLVANEVAPRPHNSGHYSIDACDLSQFDLQLRTLAQLPLVQPRQHSSAVMLNLLGDLWWPEPTFALTSVPDQALQPQQRAQPLGPQQRAQPLGPQQRAQPLELQRAQPLELQRAQPLGPQQRLPKPEPQQPLPPQEPDWSAVLALPGAHLHLYGKTEARRGRKMGHLTLTAATAAQARAVALRAAALLGLPTF